jgi:hypothetical protein
VYAVNRRIVLAVARFWRKHHIGKRIMGTYHPGDSDVGEFLQPNEDSMSEAQQSILRSILKVAAGALVTKGVIDVGEAGSLQIALEALLAGLAGVVGFYLSHRKHTQA